MADKSLVYRIENPSLVIPISPYWQDPTPKVERMYMPVDDTVCWLTEFEGETRVVFSPMVNRASAAAFGPWSVLVVGAFDLSDYVVELSRISEMP